ncbi:hypothetical protein EV678_0468 [Azospira oryzae]|uniref:Secreted protein n=1 Tax=Azospira oryzae TaxID=146939 RepID=A0ABY0IQ15_9RHOO|nr:hypothetical protein [Azospira oryzae]RZT89675.1 hypothetical protein EV678_0468 [Azospira oryzae]
MRPSAESCRRLGAGLCLGLLLGALWPGSSRAGDGPPRQVLLEEGEPVRIEARPRQTETTYGHPGGESRVEVRSAGGRYCLTSYRDNPILANVYATPGGGQLAVPTNCPP